MLFLNKIKEMNVILLKYANIYLETTQGVSISLLKYKKCVYIYTKGI